MITFKHVIVDAIELKLCDTTLAKQFNFKWLIYWGDNEVILSRHCIETYLYKFPLFNLFVISSNSHLNLIYID